MIIHKIKLAIYSLLLTNYFGLKLKKYKSASDKKRVRIEYSQKMLSRLKATVEVKHAERIPQEGQYLLISNHKGIIDPLVVEIALQKSDIYGLWISKKELYNSPFFGLFVRNAGSILLDREKSQMSGFFADIKEGVKRKQSIFIFPEGTRNKSDQPLIAFKEGSKLIALKNRLPILPVYIRTHTDKVLGSALKDKQLEQTIIIEIGEMMDFREKGDLESLYRSQFGIL